MAKPKVAKCQNPFFSCKSKEPQDIIVYLLDDKIPICRACWLKIADGDYAWGEEK